MQIDHKKETTPYNSQEFPRIYITREDFLEEILTEISEVYNPDNRLEVESIAIFSVLNNKTKEEIIELLKQFLYIENPYQKKPIERVEILQIAAAKALGFSNADILNEKIEVNCLEQLQLILGKETLEFNEITAVHAIFKEANKGIEYKNGDENFIAKLVLPSNTEKLSEIKEILRKGYNPYGAGDEKANSLDSLQYVVLVVEDVEKGYIKATFSLEISPEGKSNLHKIYNSVKTNGHIEVQNLTFIKEDGSIGINKSEFPTEFALLILQTQQIAEKLNLENILAIVQSKLIGITELLSKGKSDNPIELNFLSIPRNDYLDIDYIIKYKQYFLKHHLEDDTKNAELLQLIEGYNQDPDRDKFITGLQQLGESDGPVIINENTDKLYEKLVLYFTGMKNPLHEKLSTLKDGEKITVKKDQLLELFQINSVREIPNGKTVYINSQIARLKIVGAPSEDLECSITKINGEYRINILFEPKKFIARKITRQGTLFKPFRKKTEGKSNLSEDKVAYIIENETNIIEILRSKRITIVGSGQVANLASTLLVTMGFENIKFYEKAGATIEAKHAAKGINFFSDQGRDKVTVLMEKLLEINPFGNYSYAGEFTEDIKEIPETDIIIQAMDSEHLFYHLHMLAKKFSIPILLGTDLGNGADLKFFDYSIVNTPILKGRMKEGEVNVIKLLGGIFSVIMNVQPELVSSFIKKKFDFYPQSNVGAAINAAQLTEAIVNLFIQDEKVVEQHSGTSQNDKGVINIYRLIRSLLKE